MAIASTAPVWLDLTADEQALELPVGGYGAVGIQIAGTWAGTITFEATVNSGEWQTLNATKTNSATQVTSTTANGVWTAPVAGLSKVRARMSTYTSGSAHVQLLAVGASPAGASSGGGGGGGTSSDFNVAFPSAGTAAGFLSSGGDMIPLALQADGSIPVTLVAGGGSGGTSSTFTAAFPATGTASGVQGPSGAMEALALEQFDYDTGAGSQAQSAMGLVVPADGGPAPVGAANPLPVSGPLTDAELRATPVPVSGTVTANIGTVGTLATAAKQDTGNTSLASIDGKITAVNTGAVVVSSSALPSGASTAAKQPALGTAGTASADVISVQGIASMTPVQVSQATAANLNATVANPALTDIGAGEYETVAASQTAQVLGATGAIGDFLAGLLVTPASTSPGNVIILDNATSITVFAGGASSVSNLVPFFIPLGIKSVSGAWKVTTGANVSVIGVGNFT